MNEIVNNFLLAQDIFVPEIHLRKPGFTYSACGPLRKNEERIQKFKQAVDHNVLAKRTTILDKIFGTK